MRKRIQGFIAGVLVGTLCAGGVAFAKTGREYIEVLYDNVKIYKDNVLCELKDANGTVVEPFIYNGTTYMPVRGTANLADMEVTWDGKTKSVYLWDDMVPEGTYLMDVCPPYDTSACDTYSANKGESFEMSGEKYSNGLRIWGSGSALINLNSKYSTIECTVGHVYGVRSDSSILFIVDGKVVEEIELEAECMPKKVSIPVSYGLQLKIQASGNGGDIGIGNITVK